MIKMDFKDFEYNHGYLCATITSRNGHSHYFTVYRPNCKHPKRLFKKIIRKIPEGK